ncbi:MAG: hypothetical protein K5990_08200 [Oscillospiraceae bacterium]|nr:hypothetical protein [Oscillospiraceae bacterium]
MAERTQLSHAYLLAGPQEAAHRRALELAQAMLCSAPGARPCGVCRDCRKLLRGVHPDLTVLTRLPDAKGKLKREIYVDQIRELVSTASILPGEAQRKVYLIRDAGMMNAAAQNALLKLLEEPPRFLCLILEAENAEALLETVRSRCVLEHVRGEEAAPPPEARELAERFLDAAAARSRLTLLGIANAQGEASNAEMLDFTAAARGVLTDMLCDRLPARQMPRARLLRLYRLMERAEEYLRFNVSVRHVWGMLSVEAASE